MTTNKPEVVGFATHHDEPMLLPSKGEATIYCDDGEEPVALIRLSDYEALKAAYEEELFQLRQTRDTHFGSLMRALEQVDAMQAENALLRTAIRRLCNIYVVDDYYMGQLREERLEAAVNRAINAVKETTK